MKVGGVEISGPAEEVLVLPRPTQEDIVFRAVACMDLDDFEKICPQPKPKARLEKGGWKEHVDDPDYQEALRKQAQIRFAYMVLKSLEPSNIEWETVKMDQPSTWLGWDKELKEAGLSQTEVNRVINCVSAANSLDEAKLEAARESFLLGLAAASDTSTGQSTDQQTTSSGEAANG